MITNRNAIGSLLFAVIGLICFGCNKSETLFHGNKSDDEMRRVLDYYSQNKEDSLKYKAAVFLIENMGGHYGYDQNIMVEDSIVDSLDDCWQITGVEQLKNKADIVSFRKECRKKGIRIKKGQLKWDVDHISYEYMVENIEFAFKAYEMPWCKKLSFSDFCKYILPYRCRTEPIEQWRSYFFEKYKYIEDSLPSNCSLLEACTYLQNVLKQRMFWSNKVGLIEDGFRPPRLNEEIRVGACENLACYTSLIMRSVGIPVSYDKIICWQRSSVGHTYNCLIDNSDCAKYYFSLADEPPKKLKAHKYIAKVVRHNYHLTNNGEKKWLEFKRKSVVPWLFSKNCSDVTDLYCATDSVVIEQERDRMVFLCKLNSDGGVVPLDYTFRNKGKWCFKKCVKNYIYILAEMDSGSLKILGYPFVVTKNGRLSLKPDYERKVDSTSSFYLHMSFAKVKKNRRFKVAYWDGYWRPVEAMGVLTRKWKAGNRWRCEYSISIKDAPSGAFMMVNERSFRWIGYNNGEFIRFDGKEN